MPERILIVGGGHATVQLIKTLKENGFQDPITILTNETYLPYQRPPLSKKFIIDDLDHQALEFLNRDFFENNNITVQLDCQIEKINRDEQFVVDNHGKRHPYTKLVLALGAQVRKLSCEGANDKNVQYLHTMDQAIRLRDKLKKAKKVTIVGGGFIGLEVACAALKLGKDVTLIEMGPKLMGRVVAEPISNFYYQFHKKNGMNFFFNTCLNKITAENETAFHLYLSNQQTLSSDLIIAGIGIQPNQEIANRAGIKCSDGIPVNSWGQTSDANIFAIGDCSCHETLFNKSNVRLESVHNAVEQGRIVGHFLMGKKTEFETIPWFWSDQNQLKLQIAALSHDFDEWTMRGNLSDEKFSLLYFKKNKLIAADSVNKPADHMAFRKILKVNPQISKADLVNPDIPLKTLL